MPLSQQLVLIAVVMFGLVGCSSDSANNPVGTNNDPTNTAPNNNVMCIACGQAPVCGESCDDVCGCCCDEGEERARNGGLEECTVSGCWERVGDAPTRDAGADMSIATDVGSADVGADVGVDAARAACTDIPNGGAAPTDTCLHGAADWLAWRWVAAENMTIFEIWMHTDEGNGALFADDAGSPGAVLAEGVLSTPDVDGWRTLQLSPPIAAMAGATFWIGEDVGVCSTAESGTEFDYFTSNSTAGPWNGPFNAHPFTAQLHGDCR